jgi:hypothetical protein
VLGFIVVAMQFSIAQDFYQSEDEHNLVVMEAENFTSNVVNGTSEWVETDSPEGFSGTGAMMAVSDNPFATPDDAIAGSPVLTYEVKFVVTGTHYIWARACRTIGPSDDSYHMGINGEIGESSEMLTFHLTDFPNGTWGWINFRNKPDVGLGSVDILTEGLNEVNVYIRESGFKIDKIVLTTSDTNYYKPYDIDTLGPPETLPPSAIHYASANFNENLFKLSTNLVNEELVIFMDERKNLQGKLEIINLQGKVLRSVSIDNNSQLNLNIGNLHSGMYLVKVQLADNSILVKKFVKN